MNNEYEEYKRIFENYNGIIKTSEFQGAGYSQGILRNLLQQGMIKKIKRGWYIWEEDNIVLDSTIINRIFPDAVVCLLSALYIYEYIENKPKWHLAVNRESTKSRFNINRLEINPYYIVPKYMEIGRTKELYENQEINIFDRDRTICDVIRYSNKLQKGVVKQSLSNYLDDPNKNISKLFEYANEMGIQIELKL